MAQRDMHHESGALDDPRCSAVMAWLANTFRRAGHGVPGFEVTLRSLDVLSCLAGQNKRVDHDANVLTAQFTRAASEYESEGMA